MAARTGVRGNWGACSGSTTTMSPRRGAAPGCSRIASMRYMASDDPDFERKAADVIGLYLNPPQHAAVFAVDEKTAIQALDRLDPRPAAVARARRTPRL